MCGALCQAHYHAISFRPHPTLSGKNAEAKNKTDLSNWPKGVSARISLIAAYRNLLWHKEVEKGFAGSVWLAPCIHREPDKNGTTPSIRNYSHILSDVSVGINGLFVRLYSFLKTQILVQSWSWLGQERAIDLLAHLYSQQETTHGRISPAKGNHVLVGRRVGN